MIVDQSHSLLSQLTKVFNTITVTSATEFLVNHERPRTEPPYVLQQLQGLRPEIPRHFLRLQFQFYQTAYCQNGESNAPVAESPTIDATFVSQLAAANATADRWEAGWTAEATDPNGCLTASRYAIRQRFGLGQYRLSGQQFPQTGQLVEVLFPGHSTSIQPGFVYILGEELSRIEDETNWLRIYFNIHVDGAVTLVSKLSRLLNQFCIPFKLKLLASPVVFQRVDSAVLFVNRRYYRPVLYLLSRVTPDISSVLDEATPLFSKRLYAGIGLAEDPGNGESFGLSRCLLLAQAVWGAYERGDQSSNARIAELKRIFADQRLSFGAPHLSSNKEDHYVANGRWHCE
jgi:hypothetical protein